MSAFRDVSNESCAAMKPRLFKTWAGRGIKNGVLLRLADGQFDALLTVDQGIEYQQNLSGLRISVIIMMAPSNDVDDLHPLLPAVEGVLASLRHGEIIRVSG